MTDEELRRALDGLFAYDGGCVDSGIHDNALKEQCKSVLRSKNGSREFFTRLIRDMWMSEEALNDGYGIEDALEFVEWLEDNLGIAMS